MTAPDMSYLCKDWTPTVDDPMVECLMPAGKAVRLTLSIDKYQPHVLPTLILQALGVRLGPSGSRFEGIYLWDVVEGGARPDNAYRVDPDPRHPYLRRPLTPRPALVVGDDGTYRLDYDPAAGTINGLAVWTEYRGPWRLRIGRPKEYVGLGTPLGSVITCQWEVMS